jgi:hypothetical protein
MICVETRVHSTGSDMDADDHHEVPQGPSVGIVPILVQLSYAALILQLQLWLVSCG